jgi:hypothetical protein
MKKNKAKKEVSIIRSSAAEYITFVASTGEGGVETVYADENVWLTQKMMATLYDVGVPAINEHLKNIFKFFRIDYVRRLTYLDNPGISKYAILLKAQIII